MKIKTSTLFLSLYLFCVTASAEQWSVGIGRFSSSSPYQGEPTNEISVLPIVTYETDKLSIDLVNGISYDFIKTDSITSSMLATPRWQSYDPKNNEKLSGLTKRDHTMDIGVSVQFETDAGVGEFKILSDALSVHSGSEVSAKWSLPLSYENKWLASPYIGTKWQSKGLLSYYYGVKPEEVQAERQAYSLDNASSWFSGLDLQYALTPKIVILGNANFSAYPENVKSSPIVETDNTLSGFFGVLYLF